MLSPRARTLLLAGSLVLNVFLAGTIIGHLATRPPGPPPHHGPRTIGHLIERMAGELSPADAELLRASFEQDRKALEEADAAIEDSRDAVRRAAGAEPFDPTRLQDALDAMHRSHERLGQALDAVLLRAAGHMSQSGRRNLFHPPPPPHGGPPPGPR